MTRTCCKRAKVALSVSHDSTKTYGPNPTLLFRVLSRSTVSVFSRTGQKCCWPDWISYGPIPAHFYQNRPIQWSPSRPVLNEFGPNKARPKTFLKATNVHLSLNEAPGFISGILCTNWFHRYRWDSKFYTFLSIFLLANTYFYCEFFVGKIIKIKKKKMGENSTLNNRYDKTVGNKAGNLYLLKIYFIQILKINAKRISFLVLWQYKKKIVLDRNLMKYSG